MDALLPALFATLTTLLTVGGAYWTARKYGKMGGGIAQLRLNDTLEATMQAQGSELSSLRRQLDDAQRDILAGESERKAMSAEFANCKAELRKVQEYIARQVTGLGDAR